MSYSYRYYPFLHVLKHDKSSTERLWNSLRLIEPDLPDFVEAINQIKRTNKFINEEKKIIHTLKGLYCLCLDDKIVSVVNLNINKIDRVITLPNYRHQGHATRLIKHLSNELLKAGLNPFSPVEPEIEPLFEKLGWIRYEKPSPDGTYDYFPPECETDYKERREANTEGIEVEFILHHLFSVMYPPFSLAS
jgi:N-acetylglutamate synthase-like GNAT family acetyltransferase